MPISLHLNSAAAITNEFFSCSEANRIAAQRAVQPSGGKIPSKSSHARRASEQRKIYPCESYVAAQCQNNPCFANTQRFLPESTPERDTCRIASFDFVCDGAGRADLRYYLLQPDDLESAVCPLKDGLKGRILVVEDFSRDVVNTLGSTLEIDPLFFASHIHAPSRAISAQTPNLAMLPSRMRRQSYVSVHYHRPLELPPQFGPETKLVRATNVCRKVAVLPPTHNICIGLVQHCCSIYFCEKAMNRDYWLYE